MFGSDTLDVAVGLIFLFLLLSLICSSIREALETVLKYRARLLHQGIVELLGDGKRTETVDAFYSHPIINALFQGKYNPADIRNLPSYIPSPAFSLVVLDLVDPVPATPTSASIAAPLAAQPHLAAARFQESLAKLPNRSLQRAILPFFGAAGNDISRLRLYLENWFDDSMDRVSGWYKRRTQIIIACIGFLLAALLNLDAIGIARYLYTDQVQRSLIVAKATAATENGYVNARGELADPLGFIRNQGGIPVGWVFVPEPGQNAEAFRLDWRIMPQTAQSWFLKLSGVLLTTFSVTLGAPFWFDVLNRIMVIRSTVKPEEKSKTERSKS